MFSRKDIFNNLLGCFEVLIFMPAGLQRFKNSCEAAIKSFIIPLFLLPFTMLVMVALSSEYPWNLLVFVHLVRILLTLIFALCAIYLLIAQFEKTEYFYRFLNVSNWSNISSMLLLSPVLFGFLVGADMASFEAYSVFLTLLGVMYSGFIITYSFKLPWQLGGFIAVVALAIDQHMFQLAVYVLDWVSV